MDKAPANAKERYEALSKARQPYVDRAIECAKLTMPFVMPPKGFTSQSVVVTPYQAIGARGVRNLAAKLMVALFPPNTPFFKYEIDDLTLSKLKKADTEGVTQGMKGEVDAALGARERAVILQMEGSLFRVVTPVALQHLLITGNFLLYVPEKEGRVRGFRLDQYVVNRDPSGNVLEIVLKEALSPGSVPPDAKHLLDNGSEAQPEGDDAILDLYTHIRWTENQEWEIYQEINGQVVPKSEGTYKKELLPWLPLRLSVQPGESYGRSYVEEYLGDLDSLEALTQAIVQGAAMAARVVYLVSPNGNTQLRTIAKANTGDVVPGDVNDVRALQLEKSADFSTAFNQAQSLERNLAYAFLLNSAIQRNGERVTAEEVRYMAGELDTALGGVYTLLGAEFQLPVMKLFEHRMEKVSGAQQLPNGVAAPTIVTGLEAIGRGKDQQSMKLFLADVIQVLGPEQALKFLNPAELIRRAAASYGINTSGLVADEQQLAQQDAMGQLQQLIQNVGPNVVDGVGRVASEALKQQAMFSGVPGVQGGAQAPKNKVY